MQKIQFTIMGILVCALTSCSTKTNEDRQDSKPVAATPTTKTDAENTAVPADTAAAPKASSAADKALLAGADLKKGKAVFTKFCVPCHQADGKALGGMLAADFVSDKTVLAKSNAVLLHSIAEGKQGKKAVMPPWKDAIDEQSRKDALAYVRATFGAK